MPQTALCAVPSALVVGVCALGVLGGCDVTIRDGDIKDFSVNARASQDWSRTYALARGGKVEIVNNNGSIDVAVGAAGSVAIAAVFEAQAMTDARAKEILSEMKLEETVTPDHVRVATVRRDGRGGLEVRYKVTLPPDARLEMSGNNGTLKADGLQGHVKAMVVNGGVELTRIGGTVDAAAVNGNLSVKIAHVTGPVRLESANGRIALEIPKTAKATLNARSVNGGITVRDLNTGEGAGRRIRTLESQLNGGGPEIDLRVTNGRITITGIDSPESTVQSPESR